jgi:hypothetical protein
MTKNTILLPANGETDEEKRFREAMNRLSGQIMGTLDAAISFRQAPAESQRTRHRARAALVDCLLLAQHSFRVSAAEKTSE